MAFRPRLSPLNTDLEEGIRRANLTLALLSTLTHSALLLFELTHARQQLAVLGTALGISALMVVLIPRAGFPYCCWPSFCLTGYRCGWWRKSCAMRWRVRALRRSTT